MLTWLMREEKANLYPNNEASDDEAPDTPAPLFVARALKSAILGTPAPAKICRTESESHNGPQETKLSKYQHENSTNKKRTGILVTPGTVPTWRKKVSFGNEVIRNNEESKEVDLDTKISNKRQRINSDTLVAGTLLTDGTRQKTSLTQKMENARERNLGNVVTNNFESTPIAPKTSRLTGKEGSDYSRLKLECVRTGENHGKLRKSTKKNGPTDYDEVDTTTDLNKPKSRSGKYWKSEFEKYHQDAKLEMRKLLSHKELAKSYAKIKDERSIVLAEKLREEQRKVIIMEQTLKQMSARIKAIESEGVQGARDEPQSLVKELARKSSSAIQYKEQIEEFRKFMEHIESFNSTTEKGQRSNDPIMEVEHKTNANMAVSISQMKEEMNQLRQVTREISSLKLDNANLRETICGKDVKIGLLKDKKTRLEETVQFLMAQLTQSPQNPCERRSSPGESSDGQFQDHQESQRNQARCKNNAGLQCSKFTNNLDERYDETASKREKVKLRLGSEDKPEVTQRYSVSKKCGQNHRENLVEIEHSAPRILGEQIDQPKIPYDIRSSSTFRTSKFMSSPQRLDIKWKTYSEDSKKPITTQSRSEQAETKLRKPTLPPERIEAAKMRLAEKKINASSTRRSIRT